METEHLKNLVSDVKRTYKQKQQEIQNLEALQREAEKKKQEEKIKEAAKLLELCVEKAETGKDFLYVSRLGIDIAHLIQEAGLKISCEYENDFSGVMEGAQIHFE